MCCRYARCTRSVSIGDHPPLICVAFQLLIFFWFVCLFGRNPQNGCFVLTVPPAYYAHLAAFRARFYMEPDNSDTGSMTSGVAAGRGGGGAGGRSMRAPGAAAVRPLPALKENVKKVMFYC